MNKLYFKYGAMGSSKTAQALMCRFNYLQKGFKVLMIKPSIDTRSSKISSRIGLEADCYTISPTEKFSELIKNKHFDVIIIDECQFLTKEQVDELRLITKSVPVLCYGLLTNFKGFLFEGSKRLVEVADSLTEIKSVCKCGRKASINARFINGEIATDGPEVLIGAEEHYEGLCHSCYQKALTNKKQQY